MYVITISPYMGHLVSQVWLFFGWWVVLEDFLTDGGNSGDEFGWFEDGCVAFCPEDIVDGFEFGDIGEGEDGGAIGLAGNELRGGSEAFVDLSDKGWCVANFDVWDGIEGEERGFIEFAGMGGVVVEEACCFAGAVDAVDGQDADLVVAGGALLRRLVMNDTLEVPGAISPGDEVRFEDFVA